MAARFPTAGFTACFSSARVQARHASESSTKRWSSKRTRAKRSCSALRRGASRRSRTTASSSRPRQASRGRCPSGKATGRAGRSSSASPSANSRATCFVSRTRPPPPNWSANTTSIRARPSSSCNTFANRKPRAGRCPMHPRWSSSACATNTATGACASSHRAAGPFTRPGPWRRQRRSAKKPASTSRRSGATMDSW